MKLLPHILFEKNISALKTAPAQWTSTVPVVSAHFRSLFTASYHSPGSVWNSPTVPVTLCGTPTNVVLHITLFLDAACTLLTSLCKMLKKRRPSKQKNVSKWRQEAHNSLPKFWRIPKLDVRNVQFSPVRWLPPAVLSNSLTFPYQLSNFLSFLGFPSQWLPCSMSLVLGITKNIPPKSKNGNS